MQMEESTHQPGHIIEINGDVSGGERSFGGIKICGEAPCGFSDAVAITKDAKERAASMRKLFIAVALCVVFMGVEVGGGIKANSLAILTDAAHLLSDVAAFAISLFSLWAAGWEATPRQTYGFFRIEILGALVSIQLIWLLAGIIVYEAILRLIHNTGEVNGFLMFIVAAFGLLVNIAMAVLLGHDHSHGGHDHGHRHGGHDHAHGHSHSHNDHHHNSRGHRHGVQMTKHPHSHEEHLRDEEHGHAHEDGHRHGVQMTKHPHSHEEHPRDEEHGHAHEDGMAEPQLNEEHPRDEEHGHAHEDGIAELQVTENSQDENKPNSEKEEKKKSDLPKKKEKKKRNINVQGAYLHVLGDSIQSFGVMIGGAMIWHEPKWKIIDVICTLFFSAIVLGTTIKMLRNILEVLMESTPREIDATKLEKGLSEMHEVVAVHELHIWAITVGKILLSCHVKIKPEADADMVLDKVTDYIRKQYNISHLTIQIER
ncbi:hypothetical protein RHGRI_001898 [Rhododendron griersonianum]|uniref:Metal tolerance protein 1-like n=1 Tax=Rhododendron griersonianum TaxID=479676 RepID=A0AAV6LQS8_9ERIC|nr:hypothetical protein RHGRI_001898 [Rhododendron griersonianum]